MPYKLNIFTGQLDLVNDSSGGVPSYATFADFPATAADGSLAVARDTDILYVFDGGTNTWVSIAGPGAPLPDFIDQQILFGDGTNVPVSSADLQYDYTLNILSVNGDITATGDITGNNLSGTNTGDVTLTAVGIVPNANGASLSGQVLTLQPADSTNPGVLTAADWNTFNNKQDQLPNFTNQRILFGDGDDVPTTSQDLLFDSSSNRLYVGASSSSSDGIITIGGSGTGNGTIDGGGGSLDINGGPLTLNTHASGQDITIQTNNTTAITVSGTDQTSTFTADIQGTGLNLSDLTASQAVVTDASKNLTSLAYTSSNTGSTLVERDGSGDFSAGVITADLDKATGTLAIGANASIINIGNAGVVVNIQGSTIYENTTQLQVVDPTITLNKGGGAGSAANSGIELEENSVITAYVETSTDRNSWELKAPNTAGIVTITPGVSGFIISQGSHDPVTLTAVGSSPNGNAASLSGQVLTLQPADGTNPGVLTAITQTIGGDKTFTDDIQINGTTTLSSSLTGVVHATSGLISASPVLLGSEVSGILPIANGGTNSNTTLNNNRIIVSTAGSIVEAVALTNGQLLIGSTGAAPNASTITPGNGISVTNGVGSITISNTQSVPGDITDTSFTALDNQSSPVNITGFVFANASIRSFIAQVSIVRNTTYANYNILGIQKASSWEISSDYVGDITGVTFSITSAGQIQYTTSNTGFNATLHFRADVTLV